MDPLGTQAAIFTDGTDDLVFSYLKMYRLGGHFIKNPKKALLVGGSVYTYPHDFLKTYPEARMDVVEIDSGVTNIARKYFGFVDSPRMSIFHEDGRMFINRATSTYDAIFMDAFSSASSAPFQLTTLEVVRKLHSLLGDEGIVMMNLITSIEGERGMFLRAEYATYSKIFPHVFVFPVQYIDNGTALQNVILVALKSRTKPVLESQNPEFNEKLKHLWTRPIIKDMPILTDDFSPVEYYRRMAM